MNKLFIKLDKGFVQSDKIQHILANYPRSGHKYVVIWLYLIDRALFSPKIGYLMVTAGQPLTAADIGRACASSARITTQALELFVQLNMLSCTNGTYFIDRLEEHQEVEKLQGYNLQGYNIQRGNESKEERTRRMNRERQAAYKERRKAAVSNALVTPANDSVTEKVTPIIRYKDKKINNNTNDNPMKQILDMGDQLHVPQRAMDQLKQQYHSEYVERKARELLSYARDNPDNPKYNSSRALGKRLAEWVTRGDNNGAEPPPEAEHITARRAEREIKRRWEQRREQEEREAAERRAEATEFATARGLPPPRTEQDAIRLCKMASSLQFAAQLVQFTRAHKARQGPRI